MAGVAESPDTIIHRFLAAELLPESFRAKMEGYYLDLAAELAALWQARKAPLRIGVTGSQGSGKSTLAAALKALLEGLHGCRVAVLSIDDLYLTRAERQALARDVHPLFMTRGVPGTHDLALGEMVIQGLTTAGRTDTPLIPRFDKAADDRFPQDRWDRFEGPADIIILEGWCVGARPQPAAALAVPVNELEATEDPDGRWRQYVNARLRDDYAALFATLDRLVMLKAPDFDAVFAWRLRQEQKLRARQAASGAPLALEEPAALRRFLQHYERITREALARLPAFADIVYELDREQNITTCIKSQTVISSTPSGSKG